MQQAVGRDGDVHRLRLCSRVPPASRACTALVSPLPLHASHSHGAPFMHLLLMQQTERAWASSHVPQPSGSSEMASGMAAELSFWRTSAGEAPCAQGGSSEGSMLGTAACWRGRPKPGFKLAGPTLSKDQAGTCPKLNERPANPPGAAPGTGPPRPSHAGLPSTCPSCSACSRRRSAVNPSAAPPGQPPKESATPAAHPFP